MLRHHLDCASVATIRRTWNTTWGATRDAYEGPVLSVTQYLRQRPVGIISLCLCSYIRCISLRHLHSWKVYICLTLSSSGSVLQICRINIVHSREFNRMHCIAHCTIDGKEPMSTVRRPFGCAAILCFLSRTPAW